MKIMKKSLILAAVAFLAMAADSFAQQASWTEHFKPYGFIRNYFAYDNRESVSGTGDLYYWLPKDRELNLAGTDMNMQNQFRFLALTSRLGLDISGFKVGKADASAKFESDFYAGLSGSNGTAQLRLRQAFVTLKWNELGKNKNASISLKMGQAWHPMAADLPDIFSLESGAPFNAFSRTPQVTADYAVSKSCSFTLSALWQMQYLSSGPSGSSSNYIKYGCTPEMYLAFNYKKDGFLGRVGVDVLSIKPRVTTTVEVAVSGETQKTKVNVKDRITTLSPYIYLQYTKNSLKVKAKSIYGSAGEHINLMSGYAICDKSNEMDYKYTPLHSTSSWLTVSYGKKICGTLFLGYMQNLGTSKDIVVSSSSPFEGDASSIYFQKNGYSNINRMYRIQPEVCYNINKFTVGLEYMMTSVQYGDSSTYTLRGLANTGLHWVTNNRIQMLVKFTF